MICVMCASFEIGWGLLYVVSLCICFLPIWKECVFCSLWDYLLYLSIRFTLSVVSFWIFYILIAVFCVLAHHQLLSEVSSYLLLWWWIYLSLFFCYFYFLHFEPKNGERKLKIVFFNEFNHLWLHSVLLYL